MNCMAYMSREHDGQRAPSGKSRLQRGAQFVQLDGIIRRAVVADREQAGGVERGRPRPNRNP
jgi:hypothetical protein